MKFSLVLVLLALGFTPFFSGCSTPDEASSGSLSTTDKDIRRDVIDRLRDDVVTTRTTFGVQVDGGVVTLSGVVPGPNVKARALSIVRAAPGVKDVVDNLTRF